jgi:SagB-type dehydrogenase family enzyme
MTSIRDRIPSRKPLTTETHVHESHIFLSAGSWAYAGADEDGDDPAEAYHEAAKLYPVYGGTQTPGVHALGVSRELRGIVARSVRRGRQFPRITLPAQELPPVPLGDVVRRRRSLRAFSGASLTQGELGALLRTAYGVTQRFTSEGESGAYRAVPSAGALYPLELYALVRSVDGLGEGLYHYDPLDDVLEALPHAVRVDDLGPAIPWPEIEPALRGAALALIVTGMFWRNRFKYGQRGYRFVLLEAGHVAQNAVLAATALELGSVPVGGFYDAPLDRALGLDGLNEGALYAILMGRLP